MLNKKSIKPFFQSLFYSIPYQVKTLFSKIGSKLIILILAVFILSMGVLVFLATNLVTEFGEYAASVNEKNINEKTTLLLSRIMDEQAMRHENTFNKVALSSAVIAQQAGILFDQKQGFANQKNIRHHLSFYPEKNFFSNSAAETIEILYWGDTTISREIAKELDVLSNIGPLLVKVKENSPESVAIYMVAESSFTFYYPNFHFIKKLKPAQEYELKNAIWYQMAKPENNPDRKTIWTQIYQDEAGQGFMTTAVTPIYSKNGDFLGVAGIDITLDTIIKEILEKNTLAQEQGKMSTMFSFIVDTQGSIVAFPTDHLELFGLSRKEKSVAYGDVLEQNLMNSKYDQVRAIKDLITSTNKQTSRIDLNNTPILISSQIMPSTGWHLCIVIPESFILSSVNQTRNAIDSVVKKMNYRFKWVTLAFLVICVIIIVLFLSRQLIIPLNRLVFGAIRVKGGDLTVHLELTRKDEMGLLTQTFNTMVAELHKSSLREKEHTKTLEQKVKERTWEIFQKSKEQSHTLALLEKESRDRNKIQKDLLESQAKYRDIFENSVEGIFQSTPDNKLLSANPAMARIHGYDSPREMLSLVDNIELLYVYPEERRKFVRMLEKNRTVSGFEVQIFKKGTSIIWTSLSGRAVMDPNGKLLYILGSCEDITKRKQAEDTVKKASEIAEQANRAKSRFLATMSHEIRTPMNAVIGMTEMVLKTTLNKEQKKYLEVVYQSSEHLLALIDDILDISAIEAKKIDLENRPFDLDKLIKDVVSMFSNKADQQNIKLSYSIQEVPVYLNGDAARLRQILVNLINNAVKFTPKGTIQIKAAYDRDAENTSSDPLNPEKIKLLFSIKDTGIGIPEDKFDHIFKDFIQLESSLSRTYGGTGLGLAICKKLVILMGGDIWVESELSKGTTFFFTIRLNLATPEEIKALEYPASSDSVPQANQINQANRISHNSLKKCHILLAEDFEINQEVITPILEKHGFLVTIVINGEQALQAVQEKSFDLILMDVQMPVMDGLEATLKIRNLKDPLKASIPIIALTAHALKGDRERFLKAGMDEYLSKPVHSNELIRVISKLLDQQEKAVVKHPAAPEKRIDLDYALTLVGNDTDLLLTSCKAIVKYLPLKMTELNQAVSKKEYQRITRLAHSIKSAAKSVGNRKLTRIAFAMEQSGNENKAQRAVKIMPFFNLHVQKMLNELEDYILSADPDIPLS
ncbi:ATP-binding protein [Desulfobacula phenolica]|uniref:Sensory/regulatory protein RpfC n=1 Tax=Desulfobacula phenolica TaxID=90732 RepID=A0A1H2I9E7_9BACT|nr:ATP-binding protein [Desulfobacula phenolica]SDU40671.1 PAS domain S-box-containing protein [Desulfobacula phenolica]